MPTLLVPTLLVVFKRILTREISCIHTEWWMCLSLFIFIPSSRHHVSHIIVWRENYQKCSMLCYVRQLCTMIAHMSHEQFLLFTVRFYCASWLTRHFLLVRQRSGMTCPLTVVLQFVWIVLNVILNANSFPPRTPITRYTTSNSCLSRVWFLFTARRSYASAVLGVVIPSVCPSVCHTRALWLMQRTYTSWKGNSSATQQWLVGDVPFHLKWAIEVTHPLQKSLTLTDFRL